MASALPPSQPQQNAPPPGPYNTSSNTQARVGGRTGGRGGGGRGGNYSRGGGRGGGNYSSGRGRGGISTSHNAPNNGPPMPRPVTAVPYGYLPAYLPGASSMVEQLDRKLLVILRDGRHLIGILRSFDQFSNMVLQEASERRILVVQKENSDGNNSEANNESLSTICYQTDIQLGLFIVRGDNVVLLGEVDDDEEQNDGQIRFVSLEEFEQIEEEEGKRKEESGGGDEDINWDFDMDLVA